MKPTLTKEIAQKMYESNEQSLKDFALLNYPELGKKQLPKSWYELGSISGWYVNLYSCASDINNSDTRDSNKQIFATKEQAKASIAMAQLSQLREVYRNGWVPDCEDTADDYYNEWYNNNDDGDDNQNTEPDVPDNQLMLFSIADGILQNHVVKREVVQAVP